MWNIDVLVWVESSFKQTVDHKNRSSISLFAVAIASGNRAFPAECFTWNTASLQQPNCFTWNRRIVGSSFWQFIFCECICLVWVSFFWGGGLHRRIFVLWLERWVYWVGCRVSRETFCWIISRLVELIQICLWEWLKLEAWISFTVWLFHVKRRAGWLFLLYQWLGIGGLLMECFTWNIDISVDNEAYSSLGKTIYISRWRIRKSMSASLVFLAPRSESCVGVLNKLHGFTWNAVG